MGWVVGESRRWETGEVTRGSRQWTVVSRQPETERVEQPEMEHVEQPETECGEQPEMERVEQPESSKLCHGPSRRP